jgi:hypothetical protein
MLRHLVERLPVMVCPKWVHTRSQPIAIDNVIHYLTGCLNRQETTGQEYEIGGPQVLTYFQLMRLYAKVRGLNPLLLTIPFMSPRMSSYWVELITPVPPELARALIDGLRYEAVCREHRIRKIIPGRLIPMNEAICTALVDAPGGPGKLDSASDCRTGCRHITKNHSIENTQNQPLKMQLLKRMRF